MFKGNCQVHLYRETGIKEGEPVFEDAGVFPAFVAESSRLCGEGDENRIRDESFILLPPGCGVTPGDKVEYSGKTVILGTVRVCCDAAGKTRAYRCRLI